MEEYVTLVYEDKIIVQRAKYIEYGCYIEIIEDSIILYESTLLGDEPIKVGVFNTLIEALKYSNTLT